MQLVNTLLEVRFALDWKDVSSSASGIKILAFLCDVAIHLLSSLWLVRVFFGWTSHCITSGNWVIAGCLLWSPLNGWTRHDNAWEHIFGAYGIWRVPQLQETLLLGSTNPEIEIWFMLRWRKTKTIMHKWVKTKKISLEFWRDLLHRGPDCPNTSSSYSGAPFSAYGSPPRLNDQSIKPDFCLLQ